MAEQKIRVLQLVNRFVIGGAERLALSLAVYANRQRFESIACAWEGSGPLEAELRAARVPYRVLCLPRRSLLTGPLFLADVRRIVAALAGIMSECSIDIVHAHLTHATLLGLLATRRKGSPRLCATVHSVTFYDQRGRLSVRGQVMHSIIRRMFARADRMIAVSEEVARAVQSYAGIPGERIMTIPNSIDPDRFQCAGNRSELRHRLNVPMDRPLVVSIGRLAQPKGYPHLLNALALIPPEERPLTLIAGDGPDRADLERQAMMLGLEQDTRFLGNRHDVPALLAAADVFVLASLWEGLPLALLEAMASGVPSVVTAVGGNPDVIENGESGLLVPPADERAFAAALLGLLRDPERRRRIGKAARKRFNEQFSLRRFVEAHENLYDAIVAEHR